MNKINDEAIRIFLEHPVHWKQYIGSYRNPGYLKRIISDLIPTDVGIEFEIGDRMVSYLGDYPTDGLRFHNLESFEVDFRVHHEHFKRDINRLENIYKLMDSRDADNFRYKNAGIHIHIPYDRLGPVPNQNEVLSEVARNLAKKFFHYNGEFNELNYSTCKGHAIAGRNCFHTLEYRCITMTYSFEELLLYIIVCSKVTRWIYAYKHRIICANALMEYTNNLIEYANRLLGKSNQKSSQKEDLNFHWQRNQIVDHYETFVDNNQLEVWNA